MSKSNFQTILRQKQREEEYEQRKLEDNCNLLLKKMEQMVDNPQEFDGRLHRFGDAKSPYKSYPNISKCPTILRFLEQNEKINPHVKFDVTSGEIAMCRGTIDTREEIITYKLYPYQHTSYNEFG